MTEPTTETVDLDQIFQAAVVEHSPKTEETPPPEPTKTDDTAAGEVPPDGEPNKAQGAEPDKEGAEESLLSEEEVKEIEKDPKAAALYKQLNRAYTRKTQALSATKKELLAEKESVQRLKSYEKFISAFEQDPKEMLRHLGVQYGLIQPEPAKTPEPKKDAPAPEDLSKDAIVSRFKKAFGDEYEDFSVTLAEVIHDAISKVKPAAQTPPPDLDRLTKRLDVLEATKIEGAVNRDLEALTTRHKDWKQHEPEMVKWMQKIGPAPEMDAEEYLDLVYELATRGQKKATQTKQVVEKFKQSAAASEKPQTGVNPNLVKITSESKPDLDEAIQMALRGEVVQD